MCHPKGIFRDRRQPALQRGGARAIEFRASGLGLGACRQRLKHSEKKGFVPVCPMRAVCRGEWLYCASELATEGWTHELAATVFDRPGFS